MHIRQILHRVVRKDDRLTWPEHFAMIRRLSRWERELAQFPILSSTDGDVTAYVANFSRPQNIGLIVRSLLACPSIGRIIVSNNNPACDLARWFSPFSHRVTVLHHSAPQSCSMRHMHLNNFPSPFYLIIDDDLFLTPYQIESLLQKLHANPHIPHGLFGQQWEGDRFRMGMQQIDQPIDVISRIYAFSHAHHAEFYRMAEGVGMSEDHRSWNMSAYDDVILSFCGTSKPHIHNFGPLVNCPSQGAKDIATWRNDGFFEVRQKIFLELKALKTFTP